jgi:hypothetical protein
LPAESAEEVASTGARAHKGAGARRRASAGPRMPSTAGYMAAAVIIAAAAFFGVVLALDSHEDEAPWLMGALAAGAVLLVAAALREIVMRRAWGRYTREMEFEMGRRGGAHLQPRATAGQRSARVPSSVHASASALRRLQRRLSEADRAGALPEEHLEAYRLCEQYLADTDDAIRSAGGASDVSAALRAGQERVRALQKGHLLAWARGEATRLTQEAKRRVRMSDKIETAQRALDVIGEALRLYPQEPELHQSAAAVRDFVASVKVTHWVEMAERASFRGLHARAVSRYRDALFYLSRAEMSEGARSEAAERIQREIDLLRARMATEDGDGAAGGAGLDTGAGRYALDVEAVELEDDEEEAQL